MVRVVWEYWEKIIQTCALSCGVLPLLSTKLAVSGHESFFCGGISDHSVLDSYVSVICCVLMLSGVATACILFTLTVGVVLRWSSAGDRGLDRVCSCKLSCALWVRIVLLGLTMMNFDHDKGGVGVLRRNHWNEIIETFALSCGVLPFLSTKLAVSGERCFFGD